MTSQLYKGLTQNRVNFDEDYQTWQKGIMIKKIATVMGIESSYDPDKSYVLTVDNLIKILAIQMRFRSVCTHACQSVCSYVCQSACLCMFVHFYIDMSVACLCSSSIQCLSAFPPTHSDVVSLLSSWGRPGVERRG